VAGALPVGVLLAGLCWSVAAFAQGFGAPTTPGLEPDDLRDESGYRTDGDGDDAPADPRLGVSAPLRLDPLVYWDWRGSARWRTEGMFGLRLNSDSPLWPARIDIAHGDADATASSTLHASELRLRAEPVLHIGEWTAVHLQVDARGTVGHNGLVQRRTGLDGAGAPLLDQWDRHWQSGPYGLRSAHGGLGVRRGWVQSRLFGLVDVQIGRMGDHFGLGVLRNDGADVQSDLQSDVDRVRLGAELFGLRLHLARSVLVDWPSARLDTFGSRAGLVDYSIQDSAQATRWEVEVEQGDRSRLVGLAFGGALLWTTQDVALRIENEAAAVDGTGGLSLLDDPACGDACSALMPRSLSLYTAQGYVDWRTRRGRHRLSLAAEGVLRYGSIGRSDVRSAADSKTILAGGGAVTALWQTGRRKVGLDLGAASGSGSGGFGVFDSHNFYRNGAMDGTPQETLTGFAFHRNFRVDGLLFRDVIGAVAGATYVKPSVTWALREDAGLNLALQASVLAAWATSSGATPGRAHWLGVEPELALHAQLADKHTGMLRGSLLLPGTALRSAGGAEPDMAGRVELLWHVKF
jgi:uncharacterized protein (TIGR04551 family)